MNILDFYKMNNFLNKYFGCILPASKTAVTKCLKLIWNHPGIIGGNLVQGFRVYAWRAVPSFPQIALCALEMQSDPSPLELRTSLTLADISKDISNLRPQENNTSSFNYFQLEHLLDSDSEFVALLRLEVSSHCPNWPIWNMDYLSCPTKYQAALRLKR